MSAPSYGWVIYTKRSLINPFGNNAFDWMKSAALANGFEVDIIFEEDLDIVINKDSVQYLHKGKEITRPDFVHLRSYCFELAQSLSDLGIKLINNIAALQKAKNKWFTHLSLANSGINQPKSLLSRIESLNFQDISNLLSLPFIIKEVEGSKGEQVYLVHEANDLKLLQANILGPVICQQFISESSGMDLRVHVIGDEAIVGIKRKSEKDFRSNYSLGGQAELYALSDEEKKISVAAAKSLGLNIAGIDILFSNTGPVVCEVNGIPAFRTVAKYSAIDIPDQIFRYFKKII